MGNAGSSNNNGGRVHTTTAKKQIDAGDMVPNVTLKVRIRRLSEENKEIFEWRDVQSFELFRNKKIVMFAIAGGMSCMLHHMLPKVTCFVIISFFNCVRLRSYPELSEALW